MLWECKEQQAFGGRSIYIHVCLYHSFIHENCLPTDAGRSACLPGVNNLLLNKSRKGVRARPCASHLCLRTKIYRAVAFLWTELVIAKKVPGLAVDIGNRLGRSFALPCEYIGKCLCTPPVMGSGSLCFLMHACDACGLPAAVVHLILHAS